MEREKGVSQDGHLTGGDWVSLKEGREDEDEVDVPEEYELEWRAYE